MHKYANKCIEHNVANGLPIGRGVVICIGGSVTSIFFFLADDGIRDSP